MPVRATDGSETLAAERVERRRLSTRRFLKDRAGATVAVRLDDFGFEALRAEAARQGVPVEELAAYAVMYYLADLDSGRVARKLPRPLRAS